MDKYTNFDWDGLMSKLPVAKTSEDKKKRKELFSSIDMNGNGFVSLAEMDRGIQDVLCLPEIFDHKRPIMRAFQAAKDKYKGKSTMGDDYIEWMEFRIFLVYLRQYFEYWVMFERVDASGDHKISLEEFKKALPTMKKWGVEVEDPEKEFKEIDKNGGGSIMFDEFCHYAIKKNLDLDDVVDFDDKEITKMK